MVTNTSPTQAALLTINEYTLNTDTGIVSNNGQEWLQWDVTTGLSITQALNQYDGDGWTLATNSDMEQLLNDWFEISWDTNNNANSLLYDVGFDSMVDEFQSLFGVTSTTKNICSSCAPGISSHAIFGDFDGSVFENVGIYDDAEINGGTVRDSVFNGYVFFAGGSRPSTGVALVRNNISSPVPEPSTLTLFALGMISLASRRFKKHP